MRDCCLCLLLILLFGIVFWFIKKYMDNKKQKEFEKKQTQLQKIKLEKEIEDLEVEIEFEKDDKRKKLLENEKEYLGKKINAL